MGYADRDWDYDYRKLFGFGSEEKFKSAWNNISQQYAKLTKTWTVEKNSEWCCRTYFATKMILNATSLLNSLEFARTVGLRAANPYFEYYATLSLMRGLVCMIPTTDWDFGNLMSISHTRAIQTSFEWLAKFDKETSERLKTITFKLKAQRELISYKAPASGDQNLKTDHDLLELLIILAELAQLNSELLEASLNKNADPSTFELLDEYIHEMANIHIDGYSFQDDEDYYRLDYIQRKTKRPYHLALFMHASQADRFMAAWDGDEENGEPFTNDGPWNWQAIFDVP